MSLRKAVLGISSGILFAIVAIGLLPFLTVYSLAELSGISIMDSAPLLFLVQLFKKPRFNKDASDQGKEE